MTEYNWGLLIGTILFLSPCVFLLLKELLWWINPVKTFTKKNGEIIEIDFRKKYDAETLKDFLDVLEGRK